MAVLRFPLCLLIALVPSLVAAGTVQVELTQWAGKPFEHARSYLLVTPDHGEIRGLVLMLHGQGATPAGHGRMIGLDAKAVAAGIAVAYPAALGKPSRWQVEACCRKAPLRWSEADLLEAVQVDAFERIGHKVSVIAAGFSNGAMFLAALLCRTRHRFAAFLLVGGGLFPAGCRYNPAAPVTVFHGDADPVISFTTAQRSYQGWCQNLHCRPAGRERLSGTIQCEQSMIGRHVARFCTISSGGHSWPGGADVKHLGRTVHDFDLSAWLIQQFDNGQAASGRTKNDR